MDKKLSVIYTFFPSQDIKQNVLLNSYLDKWWCHKLEDLSLIILWSNGQQRQKFEYLDRVRSSAWLSDMNKCICHLFSHKFSQFQALSCHFVNKQFKSIQFRFRFQGFFINEIEIMNPNDIYLPHSIANNNMCAQFLAGPHFFCLPSSLETRTCLIFSNNFHNYHRLFQVN